MHFLFETSAFNDLDHFTPVAVKLLGVGHSITFVLNDNAELENDSRIRRLEQFDRFEKINQSALFTKNSRRVFHFLSRAWFGRPLGGLLPNQMKLTMLTLCAEVLGVHRKVARIAFDCGISGWGDPVSLLMTAALSRQKPIVSLPHGYPCIKNSVFNREIQRILDKTSSPPDFSIRNQFTAYVVATERNKSMLLAWNVSGDSLEIWGNARFSPDWVRKLVEIVPPFDLGEFPSHAHRVLFLLPSPTSSFHREKLISLLRRLSKLPIVLVLKPHTRDNTFEDVVSDDVLTKENVVKARDADTTRLIEVADTVINFATGAALDAIHLGKRLIFAKYLSTNSYSWEDCGGIKIAESEKECVDFVEDRRWSTDLMAARPYLDQEVFANGTITDPILYYATRLEEIAFGIKR